MIFPTPPVTVAPPSPVISSARTPPNKTKSKRTPSPNRDAQIKSSSASARLQIKAHGKGKQESWTVTTSTKLATKGSRQTTFRVRLSDVGFRVCLVYYDDEGKRREPYLCYLSAKEWQQAKRGSLANFAKLVADKLTERATKEDADSAKLGELSRRVSLFGKQQR